MFSAFVLHRVNKGTKNMAIAKPGTGTTGNQLTTAQMAKIAQEKAAAAAQPDTNSNSDSTQNAHLDRIVERSESPGNQITEHISIDNSQDRSPTRKAYLDSLTASTNENVQTEQVRQEQIRQIENLHISKGYLPPSFAQNLNAIGENLVDYEATVGDSKKKSEFLRKALIHNENFLNSLSIGNVQKYAKRAFDLAPGYASFFKNDYDFNKFLELENKLLIEAGTSEKTRDYIKFMLMEVRVEVAKGGENTESIIKKIKTVTDEIKNIKQRNLKEATASYTAEEQRKLAKKLLAVGIITIDTAGAAGSLLLGPISWIFAGSIAAGGVFLK